MDQPVSDKFSELSPVLELVYVMLTNMAKYMDVYATDIDADQNAQYLEAKSALSTAIGKFDALYGLKSSASGVVPTAEEADTTEPSVATPVPQPSEVSQAAQPYDFGSGSDPESLTKAKQAVDELKTLFADMKKQDATTAPQTNIAETTVPVQPEAPVASSEVVPPTTMPTFVAPATQPAMTSQTPTAVSTPVTLPTPTNTAPSAPAQDATEIDSILAELKKLQNKGTQQL